MPAVDLSNMDSSKTMETSSSPLLDLRQAYVRMDLDPFARGIEQLSVWVQWNEKQENQNRLDGLEHRALQQVLSAARKLKGDGGDCTLQLPLAPASQIHLMREWQLLIPTLNKLPLAWQRSNDLVDKNKELVNACCTRRPRDAWKRSCSAYAEALAGCVRLAHDLMEKLWRGDLAHHVVLQLVLASPTELALRLAQQLPEARHVPTPARYTYERAAVCILRSRCPKAVRVLEARALPESALPLGSGWLLRVAGHFVTHDSGGGGRVLGLLLKLSDERGKELISKRAGLLLLQRCLRIREDSPLREAQLALAARAKRWGRDGYAHEPHLPAWLKHLQRAGEVEELRPTEDALCPSASVPQQESYGRRDDERPRNSDAPADAQDQRILLDSNGVAADAFVSWAPAAYWRISPNESSGAASVCFYLHLPRAVI